MKLLPALVGEAIGVFGLSFVGIFAINQLAAAGPAGLIGVALAHGLMLAIMVTAFANISGGHINPAVTLGLLAGGKISVRDAILYIIAQCIGGILAGVVVVGILGVKVGAGVVANGTPAIGHDIATHLPVVTQLGAVIAEMATTFLLLIAVWGTAVDPRAPKVGGFAIGLTVGADILAIGPLTGAAMNPARAFGPAVAASLFGGNYDWANHWVYWVGPILGGVLASLIYKGFVLPKDAK